MCGASEKKSEILTLFLQISFFGRSNRKNFDLEKFEIFARSEQPQCTTMDTLTQGWANFPENFKSKQICKLMDYNVNINQV